MPDRIRIFERFDRDCGAYFDIERVLAHETTAWQDIKIVETATHGRILFLDDICMLTQSTHHIYHEHMVHVPMACIAAPRRALVIGGGDGGIISELVKYPALERIVLCEIDGRVVELAREFLPDIADGLDDARVEVRIGDGAAYLTEHPGGFDLVVIDSTDICEETHDETGIASPLASDAFYRDLQAALASGGVACQVLGSPVFYPAGMARLLQRLPRLWPDFRPMMMPCPFYISGDWCAGLMAAGNRLEPAQDHALSRPLTYINREMRHAALAVPNTVRAMMAGA